jgi:threonine/homoserine/homoserine lactone efflux protein
MNAQHNRWAPIVAFLLGFYGCLVGAKVLLAVLVHGGRAHLHGRGYRIALQVSGGLLVLFGIGLVWSGGQELRM